MIEGVLHNLCQIEIDWCEIGGFCRFVFNINFYLYLLST